RIVPAAPVTPVCASRYASTQARRMLRISSAAIFDGGGLVVATAAASLSSRRCFANAMYHTVLTTNAVSAAAPTAAGLIPGMVFSELSIEPRSQMHVDAIACLLADGLAQLCFHRRLVLTVAQRHE